MSKVHEVFATQLTTGKAALARENVTVREVQTEFSVDMQFLGQSHVVRVHLDDPTPSAETLRSRFETVYWNRFKVELPAMRARIVNVSCSVIGVSDPVDLKQLIDPTGRQENAEPSTHRKVTFDGREHDTPVYWRDHLPEDVKLNGPAVIEQLDCTILIPPGDRVEGGVDGNLTVHIGGAS